MSKESPRQFIAEVGLFLEEYKSTENYNVLLDYETTALLHLYQTLIEKVEQLSEYSQSNQKNSSKESTLSASRQAADEYRREAHLHEVTAIGIRSLLQAIVAVEHGVTSQQLELAEAHSKTYKLVHDEDQGKERKITISEELVVDKILEKITANPSLEFIIITGQPGAGKTRLISVLTAKLIAAGIVPVRNSFDQIIDSFFRLEQTPTSQWDDDVARSFDERSDNISALAHQYYPLSYVYKGMRKMELSDTLGYKSRHMQWGLYWIDKRKEAINQGKGLVVSVIGERIVVFGSSTLTRSQEEINPGDPDQTARVLGKGGANVQAIRRHERAIESQMVKAYRQKEMKVIRRRTKFEDQLPVDYAFRDRVDLEEKVAFVKFLAHNHGISPQQWLCAINFYAAGSLSQGSEFG